MRSADAPAAGWYPDPDGKTRLRWWDGLDWTNIRRAPPSDAELIAAEQNAEFFEASQEFATPAAVGRMQTGGYSRQDAQEIIAEVRTVARQELDRAADEFSARATTAVRSFTPLISEYTSKAVRYAKIGIGLAVFLFIAWLLFQAVATQGLFDWIGDRIDNLTDENGAAAMLLSLPEMAAWRPSSIGLVS